MTPIQASAGLGDAVQLLAGRLVVVEALANDAGVPVLVHTLDGAVELVNDEAAALFGMSAAEALSKGFAQWADPAWAQERLTVIARVGRSGVPVRMIGLVRGVLVRSTYRQLQPDAKGAVRVLCVMARHHTAEPGFAAGLPGVEAVKAHDLGALAVLSARELGILRLIGQGMSNEEIGKALHRSPRTVQWHRMMLGIKLKAGSRVELARIAFDAGLSGFTDDDLQNLAHRRGGGRAESPHAEAPDDSESPDHSSRPHAAPLSGHAGHSQHPPHPHLAPHALSPAARAGRNSHDHTQPPNA